MKNVSNNLSNLKCKVDQLDVDKLVPVPVDLSKLSDVVKNYVVKKNVQNAKIQNIENKIPDITNLATNTTLNDNINEVKGEITSITNLATTTALNAKVNGVKNKIPNTTNLATTTALTTVKDKMPNSSDLVEKLTLTQKLVKLKIKLLRIIIMILIFTNQEFHKIRKFRLQGQQKQIQQVKIILLIL